MYKSILVPLDGSRMAEAAIPPAVRVAHRHSALLELLTIETPGIEDAWLSGDRNAAHEYLADAARRVALVFTGRLKFTVKAVAGPVVFPLLQYARDSGTDLIVMTTHGHGPLKRLWLGSVADRVLRRSPVPTLLVRPAEEPDFEPQPAFANVLIPLDGSNRSEAIIDYAIGIADANAEFTVVQSVSPVPVFMPDTALVPSLVDVPIQPYLQRNVQAGLDIVADRLRERGVRVSTAVLTDPFAAGAILGYAEEQQSDLIALTTRGHGGAIRMMLGSVADKVVRGAQVPVLIYHPA
jgi:nucleotide-binding universal stress UspA family protein